MAAKVIGSIEQFSDKTESFDVYIERLEMYFIVNDIDSEDTKKAGLLSLTGPPKYNLLRSLRLHTNLKTRNLTK